MDTRRTHKITKKWAIAAGCGVAVVLFFAVGWSLYSNRQTQNISNFQECRQAPGSSVLLSYPEICVTKDKKQFPNPDHKVTPLPPQ